MFGTRIPSRRVSAIRSFLMLRWFGFALTGPWVLDRCRPDAVVGVHTHPALPRTLRIGIHASF